MSKFIKSIFNTSDRKKKYEETEEEKAHNYAPPLDGRRKLSISRSGRMKANKKRNSLSMELYNEEMQMTEKCNNTDSTFTETKKSDKNPRSHSADRSPEEEIDNAFEIIERT